MKEVKIEVFYRPDEYGGIEAVELIYNEDAVYVRGDLHDGYDSIEDFLEQHRGKRRLYSSLLECAAAIEKGR